MYNAKESGVLAANKSNVEGKLSAHNGYLALLSNAALLIDVAAAKRLCPVRHCCEVCLARGACVTISES